MEGIIGLLAAPFAACLLFSALHCYMGLHVVRRGVIFVDLALAQLAALGATVALLAVPLFFGVPAHEHHAVPPEYRQSQPQDQVIPVPAQQQADQEEPQAGVRGWMIEQTPHALSLLFTFIGAAIFTIARFRDERVPQEAIIGIVFVVSAALAVLVLSRAPHGHEAMESMLVGNILFIGWRDVRVTFLLYLALGVLHYLIRRPLLRISQGAAAAEAAGVRVRAWDFLFYASFGVMVTESVPMAGVLVVFSYLIIPAVCAGMVAEGFFNRLLIGWSVALAASIIGLFISAANDMPTGPALVATFGAVLMLFAAARPVIAAVRRGHTSPGGQARQ
jgi:zinc/manganese transport system permease protein